MLRADSNRNDAEDSYVVEKVAVFKWDFFYLFSILLCDGFNELSPQVGFDFVLDKKI
jgi:hypothetical protein